MSMRKNFMFCDRTFYEVKNMKKYQILLIGLVVVGLLVIGNVNANSDTKTNTPDAEAIVKKLTNAGSNADKFWEKLSEEEQKAVNEYLEVAIVTSETIVTSDDKSRTSSRDKSPGLMAVLPSGCKTTTTSFCGKSVWNVKLWCYFQKINWCYDGLKVTSKSRTRWGEVYYPFWSYSNVGNSESGGVGSWSYRAWTQGEFKYCVSTYGCIQYAYPWIDQTVYGNGNYIYSSKG